ncbi:MAG TPA: RNA methyltransferase [Thermoanaerobaculia bacterium]|nr:RNA methyltransferase [Thermoanaerobaculia bacterium]
MAAEISSRANPWYRRFKEAIRAHDQEIVIEGPKQIEDAIARGWKPIAFATDREWPGVVVRALRFSPALLRSLTDTVHSQGLLGLFERSESSLDTLFDRARGTLVMLDAVQDPGNVGAIVRLSAAFDADGVILTEGCADPFSQKALRASAGSALAIPICSALRTEILEVADRRHFPLFATTTQGGSIRELPGERLLLVFGSEGRGVSDEVAERAESVSIPMSDRVESLNVASAAAILLSRIYQRRFS